MTVYKGIGEKSNHADIPAAELPERVAQLMSTDEGRRLDPSVAGLRIGCSVGHRGGCVIGQVDSVRAAAHWVVIVSWVPQCGDQPTARVDDRGRRCQAFSLRALQVVAP